jgi:hypothetical protein
VADFYPLMARAVAKLIDNTAEARQALYARARATLLEELRDQNPPLAESEIVWQRLALEEAIRKVERESVNVADYAAGLRGRMQRPNFPENPASLSASVASRERRWGLNLSLSALWKALSSYGKSD